MATNANITRTNKNKKNIFKLLEIIIYFNQFNTKKNCWIIKDCDKQKLYYFTK